MTLTLADLAWPRRTSRMSVRPARAEDAEPLWPWRGLPEVNHYLGTTPADLDDFRAGWCEGLERSVVAELDGRPVGSGKVEVQDAWAQSAARDRARRTQAEIGWLLDPALHGQGLGTELARELLAIAFHLGVRRVEAHAFAENTASVRIMEKIGLRREGYFVEESLHASGVWLDGVTYALLAREFHASPQAAAGARSPGGTPAGEPAGDRATVS